MSNRRRFLQTSGAALGVGALAPQFLMQAAERADANNDRVLVVVQLSGGNDGLNTVIPYQDDAYRKRRPTLAIPTSEVIKANDHSGFHPALRGFADLLEQQKLVVVQGVGYANPNRSHFESMDIWHTCHPKNESRTTGWLGRYLDQNMKLDGSDVPAIHFGGEQQPLALQARDVRVPSVKSLDEFKLQSGNDQFRDTVSQLAATQRATSSELLGFVQTSTSAALVASDRVATAQSDYKSAVEYPQTDLARKLRIIAQLISAGLNTRIYYVTLDGFDTHSQQADAHAALLRQWCDAVTAFTRDLAEHGHGERVLTLSFSEFGRRVEENASKGTDHGAAAPLILTGNAVQAGFRGDQPSLTDLDDGDLKFHTDFRQVYSTVLGDWLGTDSERVIGARYDSLPILKSV
ncbi:MAG: DUF1501 domain-containing protein [Pirellulaceae bacterium]|nr:DUF1501 domain-containing protein [Pirellulaceae bacterium]